MIDTTSTSKAKSLERVIGIPGLHASILGTATLNPNLLNETLSGVHLILFHLTRKTISIKHNLDFSTRRRETAVQIRSLGCWYEIFRFLKVASGWWTRIGESDCS